MDKSLNDYIGEYKNLIRKEDNHRKCPNRKS